jgi:hypothetical protein
MARLKPQRGAKVKREAEIAGFQRMSQSCYNGNSAARGVMRKQTQRTGQMVETTGSPQLSKGKPP